MTTLETIAQELPHVPQQHLEALSELVHSLTVRPAEAGNNAAAVERIMGAAGMLSDWSDEDWDDFEGELKRTHAQLFNRPLPDFDADAA